MNVMIEPTLRFLQYLNSLDPHGYREFRLLGETRNDRRFITVSAPKRSLRRLLDNVFAVADGGMQAYFGLNPRSRFDGSRHAIRSSIGAVLDVDNIEHSWPRIQDLATLGLHPSVIVASGSGAHVYYTYTHPLQPEAGEDLAARLCSFVGCDPSFDAARCPRLPGTTNWTHRTETWISHFDPDARTPADTVRKLPAVSRAARNRVESFPWEHLEPLAPNSVTALPLTLRRLLENYGTTDRSRIDAAVAIACKRAYLSDNVITRLLIWPTRSKIREKFMHEGPQGSRRYLARTLAWADRRIKQERREARRNALAR